MEDKGGEAIPHDEMGWSAYLFVTRKQLWFRRTVYDYKESFKLDSDWSKKSDCTALHVQNVESSIQIVVDGIILLPSTFNDP